MENIKTSLSIVENEIKTISEEEENFVRMNLLLFGISPRAVRVLFDKKFHPLNLNVTIKKERNKLNDLKKKNIINQSQWTILFPRNGVPDPNMFDITLMITLLTNLTGLNHYDKLPLVTDITLATDLGRMKYYRNLIAHNKDGKLENTFFSIAWNDIIEAVWRLGGQRMLDECKELRKKILEQSTVPWNIRVQISNTPEEWKLMNFKFVGTKASQYVFKCIQKHRCVTITASSGVGKTETLRHVAIQMENEGYNVLLVTTPCDVVKFNNPNKKTLFVMDDFCGTYSINQSDLNIMEPVMESIKDILIRNKTTKIIVACRLQVYQDNKFESLSLFRTCVCNLQSKDLCLSQTEKQSIAEQYLDIKSSNISIDCVYDCFPLLCKLYSNISNSNITDFFQYPFSVYELEIDKLHKNGHFGKYCALALCVMFNNRLEEEWFTDETNKEKRRRIKNTCEACRLNRGTSRLTLLDEMNSLIHTFMKKEQDVYTCIHDKIFDFLTYYFGKNMIQCVIRNADSCVISQRLLLEKRGNITVVPFEYHQMYRERILDDWSKGRVQHVFNNINLKIQEIRQRFLCYLKTLNISFQRQLALTCDIDYKDTVLLQCCSLDDIPLITWCINHGVDPNQCNVSGESPLFVSVQEGHTDVVELLLDNKVDINKCENHEISPSFIACYKNCTEIVKLLLAKNANIEKCIDNGESPLFGACRNNNVDVIKLLLDKKADIDKFTNEGVSPLLIACQNNHIETLKLLIDNKANILKCADNKASPLYMAFQNNHIEIVKLLLDNMAEINRPFDDRASPFYLTFQTNNKKILKSIQDNNTDINTCSDIGASPLSKANHRHRTEIEKILLNNKACNIRCLPNAGAPLHIAVQNNHIEIVKLLLDNNADINTCVGFGASPLYIACQNNCTEIVKVLLEKMADVNKCGDDGKFPLYIACQRNHIEIVKILLDNKAEINQCQKDGPSSLYVACHQNHLELVRMLLDYKADIDKGANNGATPLFIACKKNHKELVKLLLDNKADINKGLVDGGSPLLIACYQNNIEVVRVLLAHKADIDKSAHNGSSPLFFACRENHEEIVKVLLDNKADINRCTFNGSSPLFVACQENHIEIVKVLLDNKADINNCTFSGSSPLFVSFMRNHQDIVKMLVQKGADCNMVFFVLMLLRMRIQKFNR